MGRWYLVYVLLTQGSIINSGVLPYAVHQDGFQSQEECQVYGRAMFEAMPKKGPEGRFHPHATWRYHCIEWMGE
jgi:hypothetical protein